MSNPITGTPRIGLGATITIDDFGNGTLPGNGTGVRLVNVESLGIPAEELKMIESKRLEGGSVIVKIPGLFDAGQITIGWELVNASATGGDGTTGQFSRLEALKAAGQATKLPANMTWTLQVDAGNITIGGIKGYCIKNEIKPVEAGEKQMVESTFSLTG